MRSVKESAERNRPEFISIRPCGPALFELVPKRDIRIDLEEAAQVLVQEGFEIIDGSKLILSIRKSHEVNLYPHGRMLVYPANTGEEAERIGTEILTILENARGVTNRS